MKKMFLLMAAFGLLLTACGDESKGEEGQGNGEKGAWSKAYKDNFITQCNQQAEPGAEADVKKLCACVADKLEKDFAPGDEDKPENEAGVEAIYQGCGWSMVPGKLEEVVGEIADDLNANNGDWEPADKEEVRNNCVSTHEEAGSSSEDAGKLCDCIVDKLEAELGADEVKMETVDAELKKDEFTKACASDLGIEVKIELFESGN